MGFIAVTVVVNIRSVTVVLLGCLSIKFPFALFRFVCLLKNYSI